MLGKIHTTGGQSFRGIAEYLLNVLGKDGKDRVAWVETRNLGTKDGMTAARVMAATHYRQPELKEAAGVPKTGRKSDGPVMHLSISWKEEETKGLTRQKMLEVADQALAKFGKDSTRGKNVPKHGGRRQFADQHQAMIVCHDDKAHPHVHIVINRVHPKHGVMLPTSFDRLKLSKVGLKFEKDNKLIVCPERVTNWEARENGQFVRAKKELPRETWERLDKLNPEMEKKALALIEIERKKAAAIAKAARDQKQRHQAEWDRLEQQANDRATDLVKLREERLRIERNQVNKRMLDQRRQQFHEREAEIAAYTKREKTALGKVSNRLREIDVKKLVGLDKEKQPDGRAGTWKEAFNVIGSAGAALQSLKKRHELIQRRTDRQEKRELRQAAGSVGQEFRQDLAGHRSKLKEERHGLVFKQRVEVSKTKAEWKQFEASRSTNWRPLQETKPKKAHEKKRPSAPTSSAKTKPSSVVPQSKRGAKLIDSSKVLDAARKHQKRQSNEKDRGKDRGEDGGRER